MPVNGMNVGSDFTLTFYNATTGALVELGDVQTIKITALKHDISSKPYNNFPKYAFVPDGYKIDFTIVRTGATLEDLAVAFEQGFQVGSVLNGGYLNEVVNNPDGTVSRYQYQNFVAFLTDHGDISRDKTVTLTLEGMASKKVKIA